MDDTLEEYADPYLYDAEYGQYTGDFEFFFNLIQTGSILDLACIPIVANADFGHTTPIFTFPIGGMCHLKADASGDVKLVIERH